MLRGEADELSFFCRPAERLYPSPGCIGSEGVPVLNPQQHRDT